MDRKLSDSYRADLALLSADGKVSLQNGQRQWIKMTLEVCDRNLFPQLPSMPTTEQCIEKLYRARIEQLKDAIHDYGGIKIRRVDRFEAHRVHSENEFSCVNVGFYTREISYPQIDAPISSQQALWNKKMADMANSVVGMNQENEDNDYWSGYSILSVSPRFVSTEVTRSFYAHGAAHGQYDMSTVNWLLNEGREMRADDVFDKTKPWREVVLKYCLDDLSKHDEYWVKSPGNLGHIPLETSRWALQEEGLRIRFEPYEVAAYAYGSPVVVIPWDVLRQYVVENLPIAK
jgi:hypothetical protein